MNKIYRFLGRKGRTTIPIQIRLALQLSRGDLISYSVQGNTIIITTEKVCSNCREHEPVADLAEQMTPQERREMLSYLLKQARKEKR